MSDKNFMALIAIIVVAVVGSFIAFGSNSSSGAAFIGDPLQIATGEANGEEPVQKADHVKGAESGRVLLIEYGDFECIACFGFFPELQTLLRDYPDDLSVVFRHNPISSLHPNAFAAHRAAEAAGNQGAFWEMHDILFERQPTWNVQSGTSVSEAAQIFESYATELGLDLEQFQADVESQATFDLIDSHLDSGNQLGVTGTPTLFLNGEEITERRAADISLLIDEILAGLDTEEAPAEDADASADQPEATEETSGDEPTEEEAQ